MAGRGQSRMRMLESMGMERSEIQQSGARSHGQLTPSPIYPPLQFKPLPLPKKTPESEYKLTLFLRDIEKMRSSK